MSLEGSKPASMFVKSPLGTERRRAFRNIRKRLGPTNYRPDLLKVIHILGSDSMSLYAILIDVVTGLTRSQMTSLPSCHTAR